MFRLASEKCSAGPFRGSSTTSSRSTMLESHRAAPLQGRATEGSTAGKLISELALNNMQHFIEFEVVAVLGAERHECTEELIGNPNGSLCRSITTKR